MSSMWRPAVILPVLLGTAASGSAQYSSPYSAAPTYSYASSQNVSAWINQWRTLRQSPSYRFADYAPFVIANPDWPDAAKIRGWAQKAMQPGENNATVIAFFANDKPGLGIDLDEKLAAKFPITDDPAFDYRWGNLRRRDGTVTKP